MFLVRSAFWLSVVILLLPAEKKNAELNDAESKVTAGLALVAAQTTVNDLSGFCLRNQTTCETGKAAVDVFIRKAQYGAGLLNNWVSGISSAHASTIKPIEHSSLFGLSGNEQSGNVAKRIRFIQLAGNNISSQHTLTKEDLRPVWGGPIIKTRA